MAGAQQVVRLAAGQPRTLAYAHGIRKDLRLLEVDEDLLQELLTDGLCLKGAPDEEAVLCSSSRTFMVKSVETTNLVLLVQQEEEGASQGGAAVAPAALSSQDPNVQPTPPGQLTGLATQLSKNAGAAACAAVVACAVLGAHLELVPAGPRLHQLDALLAAAQYGGEGSPQEREQWGGSEAQASGDEAMGADSGTTFSGGHTEEELLAAVQCSGGELRTALVERRALCLDGRYCLVDPGYQGMLLELVLLTAVEHGWPLSRLPGARMAAALQPHGYDPRVTLHCLATFGSRIDGSSDSDEQDGGGTAQTEASPMDAEGGQTDPAAGAAGPASEGAGGTPAEEGAAASAAAADGGSGSGAFALDEVAVCLHFARSLLLAQPDWELSEFEAMWQRAVPEGMLPALEMLRGEALLYGGGVGPHGLPSPRRIKHFPLAALPADAPGRFAALFAERARWEWEDLAPYIQSLRGPGQTAEALLLKYARATQQRPTDPVTYSMR
ncbi:hypothetical protein ABPG77_008747 [Micractinium sp. CCAP 211/92]